ncbi:MAG: repair exonuclease family protein YhaO [Thermoleophilia bacterium]|nr:repair exonuclease family protein YhaO [Thermoleophilia bacterium]
MHASHDDTPATESLFDAPVEVVPAAAQAPAAAQRELRVFHAADIHLGSPLRGLDAHGDPTLASLARDAPLKAFRQLIAAAIDERADLLLIAGDLLDGDCDIRTLRAAMGELTLLRDAGCEIVLLRGNHDAASRLGHALDLPSGVHELPVERPGSVHLDALGIDVVGQGFANAAVTEPLHVAYPAPRPGRLSIAMLHTSLDGSPNHDTYAPAPLTELLGAGHHYWALGHIHLREVHAEAPAWVVYPGVLQGRHARETGAHGAAVLTIRDGHIADVEMRDFDVVRWEHVTVDVSGVEDADAAIGVVRAQLEELAAAASLPTIARITITGRTEAHGALTAPRVEHDFAERVRLLTAQVAPGRVFVERVRVRTQPPLADLAAEATPDDPLGMLLARLDELALDPSPAATFEAALAPLRKLLPAELLGSGAGSSGDGVGALDDARVTATLPDVRSDLLVRMAAAVRT